MIFVVVDIDDVHWLGGIGGDAINDRGTVGAGDNFDLVIRIEDALQVVQILEAVLPADIESVLRQLCADFFLQCFDLTGVIEVFPL